MAELTGKQRMQKPHNEMPLADAVARGKTWDEVPLGYTLETAMDESLRCIQCKKAKCIIGCPVGIDIPGFLGLVEVGDIAGAARRIRETNFLPGVCGRVCPQDKQCQAVCVVGNKYAPVGIGNVERFVADYEREHDLDRLPEPVEKTGKKVAVVGAGPAGLTGAYELQRRGHQVTVFEAFHRGGGVMVYGIPRFRLPLEVVDEDLAMLEEMGVEFVYNVVIGRTFSLDDLLEEEGYDAVLIATGAGLPKMLKIPGANLNGVYSANEYLTRVFLMDAKNFPESPTPLFQGKNMAVIGAGNTAMDVLRTGLRLGANVTCVYRRSRAEAPARTEELEHAEQEGIAFRWLSNPVEFLGDDNGFVRAMTCMEMELSEPDDSGRSRPVPTGRTFEMPVETAVMSLGCNVNPLIAETAKDVRTNRWGIVMVDKATCHTSKPGVFAAGDAITGGSTVILAMGQAKKAAAALHRYLIGDFDDELDVPDDPDAPGMEWSFMKPRKAKR